MSVAARSRHGDGRKPKLELSMTEEAPAERVSAGSWITLHRGLLAAMLPSVCLNLCLLGLVGVVLGASSGRKTPDLVEVDLGTPAPVATSQGPSGPGAGTSVDRQAPEAAPSAGRPIGPASAGLAQGAPAGRVSASRTGMPAPAVTTSGAQGPIPVPPDRGAVTVGSDKMAPAGSGGGAPGGPSPGEGLGSGVAAGANAGTGGGAQAGSSGTGSGNGAGGGASTPAPPVVAVAPRVTPAAPTRSDPPEPAPKPIAVPKPVHVEPPTVAALPASPPKPSRAARLVRDVQPSYPASAREDGAEGQVTVGYQISEEGRVDQVRITRSSGDSRLDSAAVQAAERLRYEPELQEGRAIRSRARRTFLFKLGE